MLIHFLSNYFRIVLLVYFLSRLLTGDKPVSNNTEYAVQQNNVESKINDFRSGFNEVEETMTNPVIAIVHGEQSFQETDNISTHLREMIVDQRINGLYSSPMRTDNTDNVCFFIIITGSNKIENFLKTRNFFFIIFFIFILVATELIITA